MIRRRKILVIGLLLTAFALWPLLHHVIAKRYFVSPWRLFGWAMYCVPVYKPRVHFFAVDGDRQIEIDFPRVTGDDARAYERFVRYRAELGTLAGPEALGRILFREYPHLDEVIVHVIQPVYHYASDRIREAYFEYRLQRLPGGEPADADRH